jgi:uncharacterized protein (TIGR02246 family)
MEATMDREKIFALKKEVIAAWNAQDVDRVVTCYTDDLVYLDPNTRGEVKGAQAMKRYLTKLFASWKMTWALKDVRYFEDGSGCAATWRATLRRADGGETVEVNGMDLVLFDGVRIKRNEVYFDRALLAPLFS